MEIIEDRWTAVNGNVWTREEFLDKMEWEGGLVDMIGWGGAGCFPPSLREMAKSIEDFEFGEDEGE
jgi:hypothetical protein